MQSNYGRVDTNGKWFPYVLGDTTVRAQFGHMESGNVGAILRLEAGQYSFRSLSRGHIFSISPDDAYATDPNKTVSIAFDDPSGNSGRTCVTLTDASDGVHVPGGCEVTIMAGGVRLVDERVGTRGNVPDITDLIHRTDLIKQGSPDIKDLLPGEAIALARTTRSFQRPALARFS